MEINKQDIEKERENIKNLQQQLAEKDEEIEKLKANQTHTRKRLLPKNYDKLNLADKLHYKEKQVHIARIRLQEQQEMIDELDYELNKYKSLYTEKNLRHEICEKIRKYLKYNNGQEWILMLDETISLNEVLDQIEKGEE